MQCPARSRTERKGQRLWLALALPFCLAACTGDMMGGGAFDVTKMGFGRGMAPADPATAELTGRGEVRSSLIDDLQARQSLLPPLGPEAAVAQAVTEAGAGVATAELRVARLRAEAQALNWLPRIGPDVTLNRLGDLAAALMVEQTLFDAGAKRAERAHAAADVEVAAVTLATEANRRIYDGLKHHLTAERAAAQAAVAERSAARLGEFHTIMRKRIEGGLSDRSEEQVLTQKLAEMQAMASADRQTEAAARAELAAMTARPLAGVAGLSALPPDAGQPEPLAVLRARAEGARAVAEADIARARMLPGLTARAGFGSGGVDGGIGLSGGDFGFGRGARREALDATPDLVTRRIAEATEQANRRITALSAELQNLTTREAQGAEVLRQTGSNLQMFTEQYKVGRRSLLELVQQYESFARAERDQVALKYLAADLRLQIALERGVLADGARM
jgi:adhesin transport system outer membrane protein